MKDTIYSTPIENISDFVFDQSVVDVFPDMIKRSVPGYTTIIHMIGQIAERYSQSNSHCYDLGCSLGAATLAMRHRIHADACKIISVDNSEDMINRCRQVINADSNEVDVTLVQADITDIEIANASVVVLNFTLQFVPLEKRHALLQKIYEGMRPGGVLLISEKIAFEDEHHHALMTDLHHYFKSTNGYSDLEIAQKRNSIENVLIPETFATHQQRLNDIGFSGVDLWFQCFNFASFIAQKAP
ncbi:MAG: carboxy-S-adenosyl-L-methionine synthase CmoA [Agarilytica sp.]